MDNSNNDSHQFRFAGQTSSTYSLNFSVFKRSSTGGYVLVPQYNNISLTYQPCPGNVCADNIKIFNYVGSTNLGKGFYRIVVYRQYSNLLFNTIARKVTKCVVDFGVGDVYFIAGQSNASGWYWRDDKDQNGNYFLDNTISTTGEITKSSPMARTLNFKGDNGGMNGGGQSISKGIPYESNTENSLIFQELIIPATPTSASDQDNNRINIYPNGYNSWVYGPLGYKIATNNIDGGGKYEGTPSLWFNTAVGGTTINQGTGFNSWLDNPTNPSSLIGKLDYTLLNFAGPFGAKAVLWHQGEYDHLSYLSGSKSSNYKMNTIQGYLKLLNGLGRQLIIV
ncbi:MAG: hypothetical protein IPH28_15055 [Cytophagaceae bacterium]|nr:hypothetical protein [Cytophagaceae bacterium]